MGFLTSLSLKSADFKKNGTCSKP